MSARNRPLPSARLTVVAGLTTWLTLFAWAGFVERPGDYLSVCAGGIVVLGGVGYLARRVRFPLAVVLAAQLLALMLYANLLWGTAMWPSPASVEATLSALQAAVTSSQEYMAPVAPDVPSVVPLLALGGLACHLLVDFLAVTLGRVPVSGLPLLMIYSLPVSLLEVSVSWVVFVLSALGFLVMMSLQEGERVSRWGRPLRGMAVGTPMPQRHTLVVGASATGLAVVLPLLIPTLDLNVFDGGVGGGGGDGREVTIDNPMTDLRGDLVRGVDVPLLRVRTGGEVPSYLRYSALTRFTGRAWTPGGRDLPSEQAATGAFPNPIGLAPGVGRSTSDWEVEATDAFDSQWLPTPLYVNRVEAGEGWRFDNDVLDVHTAEDNDTARGLEYTLTAIYPEITGEALAAAGTPPFEIETEYTELPDDLPDEVLDYAEDVTSGLDNDFERAQALQEWFRTEFTYDLRLSTEGNSGDDLVDFLDPSGRVGYCEQFSAAMAVMARALDIPARVSVGLLTPEPLEDGRYEFSAHDLHAWPELYFDGFGWVRFEPTPSARAEDVPAYTRDQLADDPTTQAPTGPSDSASAAPQPDRPQESEAPVPEAGGDDGDTGAALLVPFLWGGGALLGLIGLALAPRAVRRARAEQRWRSAAAAGGPAPAEAAWAELRDVVVDCGVPWPTGRSPRATAGVLARRLAAPHSPGTPARPATGPGLNPEATDALRTIVASVEQARYAAVPDVSAADELRAAVGTCAEALRGGLTRQGRLRADWLPASVLSLRHAAVSRPTLTRVRSHQDVVDHVG